MNTRVLLLLALTISLALAQKPFRSQRCTCRKIYNRLSSPKQIFDIQILTPTPSCDKLEIVVTLKTGLQYCMDPKAEKLQRVVRSIIEMRKKAAAEGTTITPSDEFEKATQNQ